MPRTHRGQAISLTTTLIKKAKKRARDLGFDQSFSGYIRRLITNDLQSAGINLDDLTQETAEVEALEILRRDAKGVRGIRAARRARGAGPALKPKKQRADSKSKQ